MSPWPRLLAAARKPAVVGRWLGTAHAAQVAAVLLWLGLVFVLPPTLEATLERIHPPEQRHTRLLGFIKVPRQDVRAQVDRTRLVVTRLSFALSAGLVAWLLATHFSRALTEAAALARRREREGDGFAPGDRRKLASYRAALRLAMDREQEARVLRKIECEAEIPPQGPAGAPSRYRVHGELGRGGMGVVYRATDTRLAREVALKRIPPEFRADRAFASHLREAQALARLSHPNIVQVFDLVEESDGAWIALELVEGEDLDARLRRSGPLAVAEVVRIGIALADALDYAHGRDVLHRDVKPANVLIGEDGVPKLTDFGLARLRSSATSAQTRTLIGSPHYMSPEQIGGAPLDPRSDVYSLGISLYELLSGRVPFDGEVDAVLAGHTRAQPPPLRDSVDLPESLEELVMEMLAKSPDERPGSMREVAARLAAVAKPEPGEA